MITEIDPWLALALSLGAYVLIVIISQILWHTRD